MVEQQKTNTKRLLTYYKISRAKYFMLHASNITQDLF